MTLWRKKDIQPPDNTAVPPNIVVTSDATTGNADSNAAATTAPESSEAPSINQGLYNDQSDTSSNPEDTDYITWTASEYISHQKSTSWYVRLSIAAIIVAVLVYIFTKDKISTVVVLVAAGVFGYYAARQPLQIEYRMDNLGIQIGRRYYPYSDFRSFALVPEGALSSIILMPLKRFAPLTTFYYAGEDEDRIVQLLTNILPIEEYRHDILDQFMKRIRF